MNQLVAADRTEIALDVNAEHFFKLFAQMARNQMQRLLEHRAAFDGVERLAFLEAAVKLFHQGTFAGADRSHQVEDLAAFLALERGGVKVAHDLRHGFLDAEELVAKKIEELDRLVFVKPFDVRVAVLMNVAHAPLHDRIVRARMGELGNRWIGFHLFQVAEQVAAPRTRLMHVAIFLDESFEFLIVHWSSLPLSSCYSRWLV